MPDNPPTTQIVEQVDREAAAELLKLCGHHLGAAIASNGDGDDNPLIQAFAQHRIAALQSSRPPVADELCVRLGELLAKATPGPWLLEPNAENCRHLTIWSDATVREDYSDRFGESAILDGHCIIGDVFDRAERSSGPEALANAALIVEAINALPTLLAERSSLQARVAEAEGVIEPFAEVGRKLNEGEHWDDAEWVDGEIAPLQFGHFRAAANFLSGKGAGG